MSKFLKFRNGGDSQPLFQVRLSGLDGTVLLFIPMDPQRIYQVLVDALVSDLNVSIDCVVYNGESHD